MKLSVDKNITDACVMHVKKEDHDLKGNRRNKKLV